MLDTIVVYLHDLKKHKTLRDYLLRENPSSKTTYLKFIPLKDVEYYSDELLMDMIKFGDTGRQTIRNHFKKIHIPSSNYFIVYKVDLERDFIHISLSIPKYLYGNNIAQFIMSPLNPNFIYGEQKEFNIQIENLYSRLRRFLKDFFANEFIDIPIDYTDIEIRRLDFCFNEICHDEGEAMRKLQCQKVIAKKYQRKNADRQSDYETGVSYRTANYYFKIYHKGTEYLKNDYKEHITINSVLNQEFENLEGFGEYYAGNENKMFDQEVGFIHDSTLKKEIDEKSNRNLYEIRLKALEKRGFNLEMARTLLGDKSFRRNFFDTDFLQNIANRILRYEVSFTNTFFSNIYKRKVYKKRNVKYQTEKAEYKRLHNLSKAGEDLEKLEKPDRKFYEKFRQQLQKTHEFYPFIDELIEVSNSLSVKSEKNNCWEKKQPLTKDLIKELGKAFKGMIMEMQPIQKDSNHLLYDALEIYNNDVKMKRNHFKDIHFTMNEFEKKTFIGKGLNKNKMVMLLNLVDAHGSVDAVRKLNIFHERTMRRYIKDLEKLGIQKNTVATYYGSFNPIDYEYYYQVLMMNPEKIYNNRYNFYMY